MRRLLSATGGFLIAVALAVTLHAAAGAHFVLSSGEHISGELVDFGASGFTVRVGGQTRVLRMGQVAVIDFTGGMYFPANEVDQAGGEHLLVLSSGQLIKGRLVDVGGRAPPDHICSQRLQSGLHVQRHRTDLLCEAGGGHVDSPRRRTSADGLAPASGRVRVPANAGWVNTGLTVSEGQTLLFNTTGEVRLSGASDDVAGPAGSKKGRYAGNGPIPSSLAGRRSAGSVTARRSGSATRRPFRRWALASFGWPSTTTCWPITPARSASTSRRRRVPAGRQGRASLGG